MILAKGADAMFLDRIEITKLMEETAEQENAFGRSEVGKRLLKAVGRVRKGMKDREAFYAAIEGENEGDFKSLLQIQASLARLSLLHRRTTGDQRTKVRTEMDALLNERAKIEKKYDEQFDLDTKKERKRILQSVSRIDKNFESYLQFAKGTDTTIRIEEQDDPDATLARIEEVALGDLRNNPNVDPKAVVTKFMSTDGQSQSVRNAFTVAKALRNITNAVTGKNAEIFIHSNLEAFAEATGKAIEDIGRGLYRVDGSIHLLLPALKETTAFHEGFHHFLVEDLGSKAGGVSGAVTGMAEVLAKAIKGTELEADMLSFLSASGVDLSQYTKRFGSRLDLTNLFSTNAKAADEFLVELLARMASGQVDIKFRKSMVRAFTEYVNGYLNKAGLNVGTLPRAKTEDLVDAIKFLTERFAQGADLTEARGTLQEAADRMFDSDQQVQFRNEGDTKSQAVAGNRLFNEPLAEVAEIADRYFEGAFGRRRPRFVGTRQLDRERANRISDAFTAMDDVVAKGVTLEEARAAGDTKTIEVFEAYDAMVQETLAQYEAIQEAGYVIEINNEEPYANSADMIADLRENKRIKIFSTESGFGSEAITPRMRELQPLLAETGFEDVNGVPLLANDIFRAVHDFFGHAELGNSFGPKGEENAWLVHSRMYSPLARRAMTSETRGQNSYVNFSGVNQRIDEMREQARELRDNGQFDEAQALVNEIYELASFADQKVGIMPDEFIEIDESFEGDADRVSSQPNTERSIDQELKDKAQPIELFRREDLEAMAAKGIHFHGAEVEVAEFEERYISRFMYGYGFYFTNNVNQASGYGNELTFLNSNTLSFVNSKRDISADEASDIIDDMQEVLFDFLQPKLIEGVTDQGVDLRTYTPNQARQIVGAMQSAWSQTARDEFFEIDEMFPEDFSMRIEDYMSEAWKFFETETRLIADLDGLLGDDKGPFNMLQKLWAMAVSESVRREYQVDGVQLKANSYNQDTNLIVFNFNALSPAITTRPELSLSPDARAYYEVKREEFEAQQEEGQDSQDLFDIDSLFDKDQAVDDSPNHIENARQFAGASSIRNGVEFKQALQARFRNISEELKREYKLRSFDGTKDNNEPLKKYLVDAYVSETLLAMQEFPEAIGWYDFKTRAAMEIMSEIHPELKTDPEATMAFKMAVAITSNGNKVNENFEAADSVYREWKETGKFREEDNVGSQRAAIDSTFKMLNAVLEQVSLTELETFLTTKFRVKDLPKGLVTGELVNAEVFGAAMLGSKIGNGFLMNLLGNFDQLTMDRWFMRQYGRLTGTLLNRDPKKVVKSRGRVKDALAQIKGDRETQAVLRSVIGPYSKLGLDGVAKAVQKASILKPKRERLMAIPALNELRKASNSYVTNNNGEVEAPAGGKHRKFLRDVFDLIQQELKDTHGVDITIADLQAVNWYPEKALYQSFKENRTSQDGRQSINNEEQPDYQSAAERVARRNGVSAEAIEAAIGRVDGRPEQLREDVGTGTDEGGERTGETDSGSVNQTIEAIKGVMGDKSQAISSATDLAGFAKAQGDLIAIIADFIDKNTPGPRLKRDRRKKKPFTFEYGSSQLEALQRTKKEVMAVLQANGMSKADADALYKQALAYKRGRNAGKRLATNQVRKVLGKEVRLKTTEARRLKKDLDKLRLKATTVDEFFKEAMELINDRMAKRKADPFTRGQIKKLMAIARGATKVSAARLTKTKKDGGDPQDVMQSFIDRMSAIFDQQDAKAAMKQYLDSLSAIRKMQTKLKGKAKQPARGKAAKSIASYQRAIAMLNDIDARLLPVQKIEEFMMLLTAADSSTNKVKTEKGEEGRQALIPVRFEASRLEAKASQFKVMEELGRIAFFRAKAERLAKKNKTQVEDEFKKLVKGYALSKMSSSKRAILLRIERHNAANPNDQLDAGNPADLDRIIQEIADERTKDEEDIVVALIDDALLPLVASNIDKMMEDPDVRAIMGELVADSKDVLDLRDRLMRLDKATLIALEYRLSDYVINDSVFGMGYMAAKIRGKLDLADSISDLNLKPRTARLLAATSVLDTIDSFLRFVFPVDNATNAKIRRAIGFSAIERSFAIADRVHADDTASLEEFVSELEGDVTSVMARAIAQIYSMSRQVPQNQDGTPEMDAAQWYLALRDAMERTIEHNRKQTIYSKQDIEEQEAAFDFLFGSTDNLQDLQSKVEKEQGDVVALVDFMVDMHKTKQDTFADYVQRYLGKELALEEFYTPFKVIPKSQNENYDFIVELRNTMRDRLQEMSLSNTKRVAGASFERNKRSIIGTKNILGLDFIGINERVMRENTILSYTVGDMLAARFAMDSEAMDKAMPDQKLKFRLRDMMAEYATQDRSTNELFKEKVNLGVFKINNPLATMRDALVVRAFGGFITQTLKQSTVLISVVSSAKNVPQATQYLTGLMAEMVYYNIQNLAQKDTKLMLANDGRFDLLAMSPVFSRDFEAGQIDPFTGRLDLDPSWFKRNKKKLTDISLKNLKGTDKVAALASWFTFYGDYLITTGKVDSYSEINWAEEAAQPDMDALSYADSLVSKDQAASTPRQAAGIYKNKSGLASLFLNTYLTFARFALNKKRSVGSDVTRIFYGTDSSARADGARSMVGHIAELTAFSAISRVFLPYMASLIVGDDEYERLRNKTERWYGVLGQVLIDLSPLPPLEAIDNDMKYLLTKYILFPMDNGLNFQNYDEEFEKWVSSEGGVPIYNRQETRTSVDFLLGPLTGNSNEFIRSVTELYDATKVTGRTGKEYYIRPEDREHMQMHFLLKATLAAASYFGMGVKELDMIASKLDDLPRERSLDSEEELIAYEQLVLSLLGESKVAQMLSGESPSEKLTELIMEAMKESPMEAEAVRRRFEGGVNELTAEFVLRKQYPDGFNKYIREIRSLEQSIKGARDYHFYMERRRDKMEPDEYRLLKEMADVYAAQLHPSWLQQDAYYNLME